MKKYMERVNKEKLFVGLLGHVSKGTVIEDHKLEFVAAENEEIARKKLLKK